MTLLALAACGRTEDSETFSAQQAEVSAGRCEVIPPFTPNFEPELEWEWKATTVMPSHVQVMMTPIVVEVNGDGIPDVVFNSFAGGQYTLDGVIRAISGANGAELWTVTNPAHRVRGAASIAGGDIDGDGKVELCTVPESGNGLICFENDGTFKFRTTGASESNWGGPSFADLEGDGTVEIIDANVVYSNTGALKWTGMDGPGGAGATGPLSFAVDIDQDGKLEVVNGRAIYKHDGSLKCRNTGIGHGLAGVGNFDADPFGEVVIVASGSVSLMDDNCTLKWTTAIPGSGVGGAPNIADFDNDGQVEIGVAGANMYSVFETNGTIRWSSATRDNSSNRTGSSTFDFEGDGKAEVVYADELRLRIYDGATGTIRFNVPHSSGTTYENPVIVDVDGDDSAEIVIASNNYAFAGVAGIRVFRDKKDGWVNTRRIWNQHAYSVTNVNDNGTIPAHPATNWLTPGLNTFRANSQGTGTTSPFAAPDLVASNIGVWCDSTTENVMLTAKVRNQGEAAASAGLPVAFYRGNPASGGVLLGVAHVEDVLPAGAEVDVTLPIGSDSGSITVWAVADDDGTGTGRELECREDNNATSASVDLDCWGDTCIQVSLSDYNLFVLENYSGGHDVEGKVAAGGNIDMTDFAVGWRLPEGDISNVLVAGGNMSLNRGGVFGDTWYGNTYSGDGTVTLHRGGALAQGSPINFSSRFAELRTLSSQLNALPANGTTTIESWGGIMLSGTDPEVNVFDVSASSFTGAALLSITAPADSLVVINVTGGSATFTGFGHSFSGGIDQHGVLFNFVDATSITANGYGFWGTVLAPYAHVDFSNGSWDGGIYAKSFTGNAEGHINKLHDREICE